MAEEKPGLPMEESAPPPYSPQMAQAYHAYPPQQGMPPPPQGQYPPQQDIAQGPYPPPQHGMAPGPYPPPQYPSGAYPPAQYPPPGQYPGQYPAQYPPGLKQGSPQHPGYQSIPQQPQSNTVIYTQPVANTVMIGADPKPSNNMVFSVITCLCFSPLFGLIAICYAMSSDTAYNNGDVALAQKNGKMAFIMSLTGVIVSVALIVVYMAMSASITYT